MNREKPMSILLIEDDEYEVNSFKNYVQTRDDVKLIKSTNSSYEGIELVKKYMPEGIILDLELHKGKGSGLNFLEEIGKIKLDFKPLIIVTTNVASSIVYNHIHKLGVDFIFYKKQADYSPEIVINSMLPLRETLYSNNGNKELQTTETPAEYEERIKEKINIELDLIGISSHLKGRDYLFDAILFLIQDKNENQESAFDYVANKYKIVSTSPGKAMQTAINRAWRTSPTDELEKHYKAKIDLDRGVPTALQFIYYYKKKIQDLL